MRREQQLRALMMLLMAEDRWDSTAMTETMVLSTAQSMGCHIF
jgi:hypothetical protein